MNKGFWQGIIGVTAIAVVGVAAWQFISLHERVGTLEEEMNCLLYTSVAEGNGQSVNHIGENDAGGNSSQQKQPRVFALNAQKVEISQTDDETLDDSKHHKGQIPAEIDFIGLTSGDRIVLPHPNL